MPIHLPSISRREFLKRSLLAGAGLAFSPALQAAGRRPDANSWALLADTHIAADPQRGLRGVNMADHLAVVSKELLALPEAPAGVFVVGDCSLNSGEKGDYTTLTDLLTPLRHGKLPIHLALGNHDHRENFWEALAAHATLKRPVKDRHVALLRTSRVNWFMLDSLETTLQTPGLVGSAQLDWLAKSLDANRETPAVILVHHNPAAEGNPGALKDTAALLEIIRPRRQVKAWVFGHTHRWNITEDSSGLHLVNLPPVAYVFRTEDPSGWVQATARPDGMRLELRCIAPEHKNHGQVVDLKWRV
jgi:3',5'-cyclic-AMP phosphodiesterase